MKNTAYFKIWDNMTPRDASDVLEKAVKAGFETVIVYNEDGAVLSDSKYKEKLLSVFRAAYRHKVKIYLSDDSCQNSGTGFGQLSSVRNLRQRIVKENGSDIEIVFGEENEKYPYGHYPDLTNPQCAKLIVEYVYSPLVREYEKFAGYEFKGFICQKPLFTAQEDASVYSEAATMEFEKKYNRKPDFHSIINKTGDYTDYMDVVKGCMAQNFVVPIRDFCAENNLEFKLVGGENSLGKNLCENIGVEYISSYPDTSGDSVLAENIKEATAVFTEQKEACVKLCETAAKTKQLAQFFKKHSNAHVTSPEDFCEFNKDEYILTNMTDTPKSFGFCFEGDYCVYDWEKDEVYNFEKKTVYTFSPYGFLCIAKKPDDVYTDNLPARVGMVTVGEWEKDEGIYFERRNNKYAFYLPDKPLVGKCLEFEGDAQHIVAKIGTMEYSLVGEPYTVTLFDFQREAGCVVEAYGGEINEIRINKKAE